MPQSKLPRCHTSALTEVLREGALIAKSVAEGDFRQGVVGGNELLSGCLEADAKHEFVGGEAHRQLDFAVKVAFGSAYCFGQRGRGEQSLGIRLEVGHCIGGLQLHENATEIRYKDLIIEDLDSKPVAKNTTSSTRAPESGFLSLFNGNDLSGWH